MEYGQIKRRKVSGLLTNVDFKDPCTDEEFEFRHAMDDIHVRQMTKSYLREMLVRRFSGLSFEKSRRLVPNRNYILTVDDFVTHNKLLEENWINKRTLYAGC